MNWHHIMDKQPAHDEMIVECHLPPQDGHYIMGMRKYYQTCNFVEILDYFKRFGEGPYPDFYWISASEFPFPEPRDIK